MNGRAPQDLLDITIRDFVGGQKLFNRYRLVRTLGRGGMGVVWLGYDEELERDVALKFLPDLIIHDRGVLSDLKRETKRSLELTHKNIVRIYDFINDDRSAAISMEFVDGDTLSNLRADRPNKVFEPPELVEWVQQACEALDYAHTHAQVIHRDLKPSNLMVNKRNEVKVADFGIARRLGDSVSMMTMGRSTSGTLVYMSPQQLDGDRGTPADDIYSFGATLYELITSKPPFFSGNVDRQIREKRQPSMMHRRLELEIEGEPIDPLWEELVADCLHKDPTLRPKTILEIAERLSEQPQRSLLASFFLPARARSSDRPTGTHAPKTKPATATKPTKVTKPKTVKPKREPRYIFRRAGAAVAAKSRSTIGAVVGFFALAFASVGNGAAVGVRGIGSLLGATAGGLGRGGTLFLGMAAWLGKAAAAATAAFFRGSVAAVAAIFRGVSELFRGIAYVLAASAKTLAAGLVSLAAGTKKALLSSSRGAVTLARRSSSGAEAAGRTAASAFAVIVKETVRGSAIVLIPAALVGAGIWFFALRPAPPPKPVSAAKPKASPPLVATAPIATPAPQPSLAPSAAPSSTAATALIAAAPRPTQPPPAPAVSLAPVPAPPPPPPPVGSLRLETTPAGAHVMIDNVASQDTPLTATNLSPGNHHVRVEMPEYKAAEFDVVVRGGELLTPPAVTLEPIAPPGPAIPEQELPPVMAERGLPPKKQKPPTTAKQKPPQQTAAQKPQSSPGAQTAARRSQPPPAPSAKPKQRAAEQPVLPFQGTAPGG